VKSLPFSHNKLTAGELLQRIRTRVPTLLAGKIREFDAAAWTRHCAQSGRSDTGREGWIGGWMESATEAMDLPNHRFASVGDLVHLIQWAHGAVAFIVEQEAVEELLRADLARARQDTEAAKQREASTATALRASQDRETETTAALVREQEAHASSRRHAAAESEAAQTDRRRLEAELAASRSSEAAWRTTAEATASALRTLEIAASIRVGPDSNALVRR